MQNQEVLEIISNLKGRKNYEEKKSQKLGFKSLYDYVHDKLEKSSKAEEEKKLKAEKLLIEKELLETTPEKKESSCSCC
jgi:flagellin-specific chaperone FliS